MTQFDPMGISVVRYYRFTGVEEIRDNSGVRIAPEEAGVHFRSYKDELVVPSYVTIRGRRLGGKKTQGTYSEGGYSVLPDGTVQPHYKYGEALAWVSELVQHAIAEHAGGAGLAPPPIIPPAPANRVDRARLIEMLNESDRGDVIVDIDADLAQELINAYVQERRPLKQYEIDRYVALLQHQADHPGSEDSTIGVGVHINNAGETYSGQHLLYAVMLGGLLAKNVIVCRGERTNFTFQPVGR